MSDAIPSRDEVFRRLYAAHVDRVLGYALRRVDRPEDAADVVAETFLVAWRRLGEVPEGDEARPWLYGVARRTLANQRRGDQRRHRLGERLREQLSLCVPDPADPVASRVTLRAALARLRPSEREVLELSLWEDLEPRQIATVLGLSSLAVRSRLSRARTRLRDELGEEFGNEPLPAGHDSTRQPTLARKEAP